MHQPASFTETNQQALKLLVQNYPLATLVVGAANDVLINHVPLLWNGEELQGHVASANELVAAVAQHPKQTLNATAIFHGPEGYISPNDYPEKQATGKVVPTWNYAVVHIQGALQLREDTDWIRQQVDELTTSQERRAQSNNAPLWTLEDAPEKFAATLLRSITGVSLAVHSIDGKFKLSQNRPKPDQVGASTGARSRGQTALADLMDKTNR